MSSRILLPTRQWLWFAPLLSLLVAAGVVPASDRLLVPEDTSLPFWERLLGHSDSGDVVFVFYRPLMDVPADFNFHNVFDFAIDPDVPLLVEGFILLDEGAFTPKQVELKNAADGQVVICIVDRDELDPLWFAEPPTPFTIDDLLGMASLRIGEADFYHETLHPIDPLDPSAPSMIEVAAKGVLQDGRTFFVQTAASQLIVRISEEE